MGRYVQMDPEIVFAGNGFGAAAPATAPMRVLPKGVTLLPEGILPFRVTIPGDITDAGRPSGTRTVSVPVVPLRGYPGIPVVLIPGDPHQVAQIAPGGALVEVPGGIGGQNITARLAAGTRISTGHGY